MDGYLIGYLVCGIAIFVIFFFAIFAQIKVSSTYSKYSEVVSKSGITGGQLAQTVLAATKNQAQINVIGGNLTDNYDPVNKRLNISRKNFYSNSVASLGVVGHELGHYLQHQKAYKPFLIRQTVVKVCNFASGLLMPMLILGVLLNAFVFSWVAGSVGSIIIYIATILYGLSALANLVTLPVEIDASRRAQKMLNGLNVLDKEELAGTRQVLTAAAMTYVASLALSLAYFLRLLFLLLLSSRDN